jgi:hypothetical protein
MTRHTKHPNFGCRGVIFFELMADLGISQSYFSCYKYPESELVRITKVVVFSTMNPTKLVLQFSEFPTIF